METLEELKNKYKKLQEEKNNLYNKITALENQRYSRYQRKMNMNNNDNNLEILEEFTYSILKDLKSLEPDISQLVDGYFWHLVVQNLKK